MRLDRPPPNGVGQEGGRAYAAPRTGPPPKWVGSPPRCGPVGQSRLVGSRGSNVCISFGISILFTNIQVNASQGPSRPVKARQGDPTHWGGAGRGSARGARVHGGCVDPTHWGGRVKIKAQAYMSDVTIVNAFEVGLSS